MKVEDSGLLQDIEVSQNSGSICNNLTKTLYIRESKSVWYHQTGGLGKPEIYWEYLNSGESWDILMFRWNSKPSQQYSILFILSGIERFSNPNSYDLMNSDRCTSVKDHYRRLPNWQIGL